MRERLLISENVGLERDDGKGPRRLNERCFAVLLRDRREVCYDHMRELGMAFHALDTFGRVRCLEENHIEVRGHRLPVLTLA